MVKRNNSFAFYTATGRILAMLCNFVVPLFLTRYLSQGDYGVYSQYLMVLTFTGSIFSFGVQSNLYYFYPNASEEEQKALIGNTFIVLIMSALLAFAFLEIPWTSHLLIKDNGLLDYKTITAIAILMYIPSFILFPLFVIKGDKLSSVLYPSLEIVVKVAFVVVTTLIFGKLRYIFYSLLVFQLIVFIFAAFYVAVSKKNVRGKWFDKNTLLSQIKYAAPFGFAIVLATMSRQFDKVLCLSYISPEEYAIYSLAFYGIPGVNQVYDSVAEVNLLNMAHSYRDGNIEETHDLYKSFCTRLLSFSVPIIAIVFLFATELFDFLFTKEYLASVPFFRIYIFSFVLGALGAGTVLRATGKTNYSLRAYLYSMIFYLPFSYFSIRFYGIWGAIITAMLGIVLPKVFQIHYERILLGVSIKDYMPWTDFARILVISIVVLLPIIIAHLLIPFSIWAVAFASIIYILVVYIIEIKKSLFLIDSAELKLLFDKYLKR